MVLGCINYQHRAELQMGRGRRKVQYYVGNVLRRYVILILRHHHNIHPFQHDDGLFEPKQRGVARITGRTYLSKVSNSKISITWKRHCYDIAEDFLQAAIQRRIYPCSTVAHATDF